MRFLAYFFHSLSRLATPRQQVVASNVARSSSPFVTHECFFLSHIAALQTPPALISKLCRMPTCYRRQKSAIRRITHDEESRIGILVCYFCIRQIYFDRLSNPKKKEKTLPPCFIIGHSRLNFRQKLCLSVVYNIFRYD